MYVCMYPCTSPLLPSISRKKNTVFPAFSQRGRPKTLSFSRFSAKGCRKPKPAKKPAGGIELGPLFCDTGSPKTTFSGTSSNCRAVRGGPPPPKKKTYVIDVGRGGLGGGYPLSSSKYPTRRAMSADSGFVCFRVTFSVLQERTERPTIWGPAVDTLPNESGWGQHNVAG